MGHRCPYGCQGNLLYYVYTIPPNLAQLRKNDKNHTKNREIRDPYPTPVLIQDFDSGVLAEPRGVTKSRSHPITAI